MSSRRKDERAVASLVRGGVKVAAILLLVVGVSLVVAGSPAASSGSGDRAVSSGAAGATAAPVERIGKLPVRFEQNVGQTDADVLFLARGTGYTVFLTRTEAVLTLARKAVAPGEGDGDLESDVVRLSLAGGNQAPEVVGLALTEGHSNYYGGSDPSGWHEGVATYGGVAYRNAYPGIDMVFHGEDGQVKFDFVVAPGADPGVISVQVDGAGMALDGGDLVITTPGGAQLRKPEPVVYQDVGGSRRTVDGSYVVEGGGRFGFGLGSYDRTLPLVVDPALAYSFNLQGQEPYRIAVDGKGNVYVHGETMSAAFPGRGSTPAGTTPDVYVAKLTTDGAGLLYATFLGKRGESVEAGNQRGPQLRIQGLDVDVDGRAYVTGETLNDGIPLVGGGTARDPGPISDSPCPRRCSFDDYLRYDGFLVRLGANGRVTYGTYLQDRMRVKDMAVDDQGVYLVGNTRNPSLATTASAVQATPDGSSLNSAQESGWGFVARVVPGPNPSEFYRYLSYFGNSLFIQGIAVDGSGNAHVAGTLNWYETPNNGAPVTGAPDQVAQVPVKNGFQATRRQRQQDMFVAKLDTNSGIAPGASLVYSTYLSGSSSDCPAPGGNSGAACQGALGIAVNAGMMYVTGFTGSSDFPTRPAPSLTIGGGAPAVTGPYQAVKNGGWWDAFVAQIDPRLSADASLVYSTYLGGEEDERAYGIAVASPQAVTVTGWTNSSLAFPVNDALTGQDKFHPGATGADSKDGFVTTLDLTKLGPPALVRSSYLGGTKADEGRSVALDPAGDLYLRGKTDSSDFPSTAGAFSAGGGGGFVSKIGSPKAETNPCVLSMGPSAGSSSINGGSGPGSAALVSFEILDGGLWMPAWAVAALQRRRSRRTSAPEPGPGGPPRRRGQGGFTLTELLVVVVILGILAAVVVFAVRGADNKGKVAAAQTDERTIRTALEVYCSQKGTYPKDPPPDAAGVDKDPMDVLVEEKFLGNRSTLHSLRTGELLPEGQCPGTPSHYELVGPPVTAPDPNQNPACP